ncbi:hypothetical protein KAE78_12180 [Microbacterium sp. NIBRBAC000506063]|nr:hypothetical protein KAE78_12180 [Microbacterium sp. NIBRBAC000506063]
MTFVINDAFTWSDGEPVVGDDVVFNIELIKAAIAENASNWSYYTPGQFPDDLVSATASGNTVTLELENAYNPSYFTQRVLRNLVPLPSTSWNKSSDDGPALDFTDPENARAIYAYLNGASQVQETFATNPLWQVVNGPFRISSFDPATGSHTLVPNEHYTGPNAAAVDTLSFKAFTSADAILNQLRGGELTVALLDPSQVGQLPELERAGYHYYGLPSNGQVNSLFLNFKNTTNNFDKLVGQHYFREVLQRLVDQPGYIASRGIYNGAAAENYTSTSPNSPFAAAFGPDAPYPHDLAVARQILEDHGWDVVEGGVTTCVNPGSGEGQCGEGIDAGQDISFTHFYANSPATIEARNLAFVSEAKKLGITIEAASRATSFMWDNFDNNFAPDNVNLWATQDAGPINLGDYPSAGIVWSTDGTFNGGHYSNAELDALMEASVFGDDPTALSQEATLLGEDLPVIFLPNPTNIAVWKSELSGPREAFAHLPLSELLPELWYFTE